MRLVFDDRALADLEAIFEWIAKDNPAAADEDRVIVTAVFHGAQNRDSDG